MKDKQTGLIWQRCSLGQTWDGSTCTGTATTHNWKQALSSANDLGNGYRLPNIKELLTLVEKACYKPAINSTIFPNTKHDGYWSASPGFVYKDLAWGVYFSHGFEDYGPRNNNLHVRAVRSMNEE